MPSTFLVLFCGCCPVPKFLKRKKKAKGVDEEGQEAGASNDPNQPQQPQEGDAQAPGPNGSPAEATLNPATVSGMGGLTLPPLPVAAAVDDPSPPAGSSLSQGNADRLLQLVSQMRAAGASLCLDLPTLVVIGKKKAGKTSIVEAICGVPLPRDPEPGGARCAMEVRLTQALSPSAQAALQQQQQALASQQGDGNEWDVEDDGPGGPASGFGWVAAVKIHLEFDPGSGERLASPREVLVQAGICRPTPLEKAIRTAQELLLTPGGAGARGSGGGGKAGRSKSKRRLSGSARQFSRNLVVLEVEGAPVTLTLVDLPGLDTSPSSDPACRSLVLDLMHQHMARESAVIVAALSCKEDVEAQGVLRLAREADPEGRRTLGVLTKPDMIEQQGLKAWTDVLAGSRYPLALGFHAVRNPSKAQLAAGMRPLPAREAEAAFFSGRPWQALPPHVRARLGTPQLRSALSAALLGVVECMLPGIRAEAQRRLTEAEGALEALPPVARGDPARRMGSLVNEVCSRLRRQLLGQGQGPAEWGPYQQLLALCKAFKSHVYSTKPQFVLQEGQAPFTCLTDDDLAAVATTASPTPDQQALAACIPMLQQLQPSVAMGGGGGSYMLGLVAVTPPISVEGVRVLVASQQGSGATAEAAVQGAVQALISRSTSSWPAASDRLLDMCVAAVEGLALAQIGEVMGRFPTAMQAARSAARDLTSRLAQACRALLASQLALEQGAAFTLNRAEFEAAGVEVLRRMREAAGPGPGSAEAGKDPATAAAVAQLLQEYYSKASGSGQASSASPTTAGVMASSSGPAGGQQLQHSSSSSALGLSAQQASPFAAYSNHSFSRGPLPVGLQGMAVAPPASSAVTSATAAPGSGSPAAWNQQQLARQQAMAGSSSNISLDTVLSMMAAALTFFGVASRRAVDYVPLHVMHHVVHRFADQLQPTLMDALLTKATSAAAATAGSSVQQQQQQLEALLLEDTATTAMRAELEGRWALMVRVLAALQEVGGPGGAKA